ncbi:MAG TPA: transferrin receptor-like dimerization domain-containing protein [Thermoanaerobaculia bacterium]|jgi:N-acetylated-alpha-linked acidic dipeptidase|nr:transferrin receptor-like dimerization domain-containing protein [Thermoanaerobaculia bacterium]
MKRFLAALLSSTLLAFAIIGAAAPVTVTPQPPLRGFFAADAAEQRRVESEFRKLPDPAVARETDQRLSASPHHLGSAQGQRNAEWILARFREFGLDARIETFQVLFPTPKERVVELTAPTRFRASLAETALPEDPTTGQKDQLPTYNAYSIDGDVTAPLVYVNFGVPDDYERLERLGVDVKGKIVIARYGGGWRGIKPKVAAEKGAIGCIIYSDPKDDGYYQGETYPAGPFRPPQGVQRGSVADMPIYSGDPLTPGVGATENAKRLDRSEAATITKIPVLPISYADAKPLLAALRGPTAPETWRGALPITYRVGPGPATVHLKLVFDWKLVPARDVIAVVPGAVWPDEWIVRGNHHDAWVNGSEDPVSGLSALLEEARAYGALLKTGWRPKRTIVLCAWDGEEEGLLGSTEWAETHADELSRKAVVYINTDGNDRGFLDAGGSHALEPLVSASAAEVEDPQKKISVLARARLKQISDATKPEDRQKARDRAGMRIEALGSGSDFTPFLQHIGIASLNLGFAGESNGGVYHSIYDDFRWYSQFSDTDFVYARALAQTAGTISLRLANADVLPFDFTAAADAIGRYVKEVSDLADAKRRDAEETNKQLEENLPWAVSDPKQPFVSPKQQTVPPHFDFAPLQNASDALTAAAADYARAFDAAFAEGAAPLDAERLKAVNALLRGFERALTSEKGLPGRPWYRHLVYAPGAYTGYGVKTLPAVREALEQKRWDDVNPAAVDAGRAIEQAAAQVRAATQALSR